MLDLGWSELALIAVLAVIVLGPKELPQAMRTLGRWTRKIRGLAGDFQRHLDDMVRESELDEVKKSVEKIGRTDIGSEIDKAVDPDGSVSRSLRFDDHTDPTGPSPTGSSPSAKPAAPSTPSPAASASIEGKAEKRDDNTGGAGI